MEKSISLQEAQEAQEAILKYAEILGMYGKQSKGDTTLLIVTNLDMGDGTSKIGVGLCGNLTTSSTKLIKAMANQPELKTVVISAAMGYGLFGGELEKDEPCTCPACTANRMQQNPLFDCNNTAETKQADIAADNQEGSVSEQKEV